MRGLRLTAGGLCTLWRGLLRTAGLPFTGLMEVGFFGEVSFGSDAGRASDTLWETLATVTASETFMSIANDANSRLEVFGVFFCRGEETDVLMDCAIIERAGFFFLRPRFFNEDTPSGDSMAVLFMVSSSSGGSGRFQSVQLSGGGRFF